MAKSSGVIIVDQEKLPWEGTGDTASWGAGEEEPSGRKGHQQWWKDPRKQYHGTGVT